MNISLTALALTGRYPGEAKTARKTIVKFPERRHSIDA